MPPRRDDRLVTLASTFALMQSASGTCVVCRAPLKWAEISYLTDPDGTRMEIRWLVCKNNHQTVSGRTAAPSPESHPGD